MISNKNIKIIERKLISENPVLLKTLKEKDKIVSDIQENINRMVRSKTSIEDLKILKKYYPEFLRRYRFGLDTFQNLYSDIIPEDLKLINSSPKIYDYPFNGLYYYTLEIPKSLYQEYFLDIKNPEFIIEIQEKNLEIYNITLELIEIKESLSSLINTKTTISFIKTYFPECIEYI